MLANGKMKVSFSDNIGNTPAIVRRDTGEIFLNRQIWFTLPLAYRRFILMHEAGHYLRQSTNELVADHFAFNQIAGTFPESLKNTVRTLYGVLPFNTETQRLRLENMYRLALTYDQYKKPTAERLAEIRRIETDIKQNYALNEQLNEYMTTQRRGKVTDYEFPGYDPALFEQSIGKWFRDIPITNDTPQTNVPWPSGTADFIQQPKQDPGQTPVLETYSKTIESVPLSQIPEISLPFDLDWKSVAIGILVILAIIGLAKS